MSREITGSVPKLPADLADTYVNRAWRTVRERSLWSFNLFEGQWISPPSVTVGTAAVTQGSADVVLDAAAAAALIAALAISGYSLITQRQFRVGASGIANIWAWDGVNTLTLDRPWGEVSNATASYVIFQCYYAPQLAAGSTPTYLSDFKSWISVRNLQLYSSLYTSRYTRADLDNIDPLRMWVNYPSDVVPYQKDQRAASASATSGILLYELWGPPLVAYVFQLLGIRRGLDLSAPDDELPSAIGEDCVLALARTYAYEWAQANMNLNSARDSGPDWRFLMGASAKEHDTLLRMYRQQDREQVDNFFSTHRSAIGSANSAPLLNTLAGVAYPGRAF